MRWSLPLRQPLSNAKSLMSLLLLPSTFGANPFLDTADDKLVSAQFRGTK